MTNKYRGNTGLSHLAASDMCASHFTRNKIKLSGCVFLLAACLGAEETWVTWHWWFWQKPLLNFCKTSVCIESFHFGSGDCCESIMSAELS